MTAQQSDSLPPHARPTNQTNIVFTLLTPTTLYSKLVGRETETAQYRDYNIGLVDKAKTRVSRVTSDSKSVTDK